MYVLTDIMISDMPSADHAALRRQRQLFANRLRFDEHGYRLEMDDPAWHTAAEAPRANFDTLFNALVTVFQALTGEDWNVLMYSLRRSTGNGGWLYVV
jgi:hypothetical protein